MHKKLSVILPTYNEKGNIRELIKQVYYYAGKDLYEVIVVDDNSPDDTWKIVKKLQKNKKFKKLKLNRRIDQSGLPSAIWTGIKQAKGDIVIWMDCDLTHPPKEIPRMVKHIPEYDIVVASRFVEGGKDKRRLKRVFVSKAFSIVSNMFLHTGIKDVISGYYAVKKNVFDKIKLKTNGYAEYCIRFTCQAKRKSFKIKEVGYVFTNRIRGNSKTDADFRTSAYYGYLCLKEILRLSIKK